MRRWSKRAGRAFRSCVKVNAPMLADVPGDEVETYPLIAGVVQPTAASADQPGLRRASPWATSDRSQRPPRSATIKPTQAHAKANQNRRDKRHDAGPGRCFRPGKPGIALFNVELILPLATVARTVAHRCRKATFKAPRSPAPGTARISI
jgi:hypothetical protein